MSEVETRARLDAEAEARQGQGRGGAAGTETLNVFDLAAVYRPIIEPIVQQMFYLRRALER